MAPSPRAPLRPTVYSGNFLWTPALGQLEVRENTAVGVNSDGVIAFVLDTSNKEARSSARWEQNVLLKSEVEKQGWMKGEWELIDHGNNAMKWWFPGFIGTSADLVAFPFSLSNLYWSSYFQRRLYFIIIEADLPRNIELS